MDTALLALFPTNTSNKYLIKAYSDYLTGTLTTCSIIKDSTSTNKKIQFSFTLNNNEFYCFSIPITSTCSTNTIINKFNETIIPLNQSELINILY